MTTPFENFVNTALGKSLSADVTLPTADDIPVFTGIGRQVTGKTLVELGIATTTDVSDVLADANEYTDAAITKVWKDQGNYDVSGGTAWPTSANTIGAVPIKAGFLWVVANAGTGVTLTGSVVVSNGDTLRALIDDAGNNAAHWGSNEANLGYTPENQANKVTDLTVPSDTTFPSTNAVITGLGTREPTLPTNVTSSKFLREDRTWQVVPAKAQVYTTGSNYAVGDTVNHLGSTWTCNTAITSAPATMLVTSWDLTGLGAVRGFFSAFDITQTNYTDDGGGNSGRSFVLSGSTFTLRNSSNVNLKIGSKVVVNCFTGGGTVNIAVEAGVSIIGGVTSGVQTITCVKISTDVWLTYS